MHKYKLVPPMVTSRFCPQEVTLIYGLVSLSPRQVIKSSWDLRGHREVFHGACI